MALKFLKPDDSDDDISLMSRTWRAARRFFSITYSGLQGIWNLWDATGARIVKITGLLAVTATLVFAVVWMIYLMFYDRSPKNCMAPNIELSNLQSCVFDSDDFHRSSEFVSLRTGSRLSFKSTVLGNFSTDVNGKRNALFSVGHWGPMEDYARALIFCHKEISDNKADTDYFRAVVNLRQEASVVATGVIARISRQGLWLDECFVVRN